MSDVDAALAQIETAGGTKMIGPDRVPGGHTIGLVQVPESAT